MDLTEAQRAHDHTARTLVGVTSQEGLRALAGILPDLLASHRPVVGHDGKSPRAVVCFECAPVGGPLPWPCRTYSIIATGAANA